MDSVFFMSPYEFNFEVIFVIIIADKILVADNIDDKPKDL
jgi:hypothetical protein